MGKHKIRQISPLDALYTSGDTKKPKQGDVITWEKADIQPGMPKKVYRQAKFGTQEADKLLDEANELYTKLQSVVASHKIQEDIPSGLSVKKVKGGYEVIHTKSGNRLMPFAYPEKELATDFARRAGQVGVDWTRPFPELQKESEKIADLIRGGEKPGMFEKVLDMPTTFPITQDVKKEPWQMTRKEYGASARAESEDYYEKHPPKSKKTAYSETQLAESLALSSHHNLVRNALEEGKPVPAEVLADYPDLKKQAETEAKKQFESKWAKAYGGRPETVKAKTAKTEREERSETSLQSIHDSRSPRSKESDERQSNADTIEPDDLRVEQWVKDQGRMDIVGIDTPRKRKGKKVVHKARKSTRTETQVRGIRR